MRVGINGRFLVAKRTGVQRTAYNLVATLVQLDRKNEYYLFTGEDEQSNPDWQYPNVHVITSNLRRGSAFWNLCWEQLVLPRLASRYEVDVLHSPANMAPLFYRGRSIIHIHDLCFIVNPQWYSFLFRNWYSFVTPILARNASQVVTNSNNSKNDLIQFFGLQPSKISLVYWAVDNSFYDETSKSAVDVGGPYILYVGSIEPRKNIKALLLAFHELKRQRPDLPHKLVLIGGVSRLFARSDLDLPSDNREDIVLKGFINESDLRAYYQNATLLVYPSLYEGFGLPPLEAMASGTPVVTTLSSSIPEVVGTAAIQVSPFDVDQLSDAMLDIIENPTLRESLVEAGYQQVRRFSWERVARNLLAVYEKVFRGRNVTLEEWGQLLRLERSG